MIRKKPRQVPHEEIFGRYREHYGKQEEDPELNEELLR